jgi:hypothetical protein
MMPAVQTSGDEEGVGCRRRPNITPENSAGDGNIGIDLLSSPAHLGFHQKWFPKFHIVCDAGSTRVAEALGEHALHHVAAEDADSPLSLLLHYFHIDYPLITMLKTRH